MQGNTPFFGGTFGVVVCFLGLFVLWEENACMVKCSMTQKAADLWKQSTSPAVHMVMFVASSIHPRKSPLKPLLYTFRSSKSGDQQEKHRTQKNGKEKQVATESMLYNLQPWII